MAKRNKRNEQADLDVLVAQAESQLPEDVSRNLRIERVEIESLTPDPRNARTHPTRNLEAIERSLKKFGQQKPIVIDASGLIVAGNGTVIAAQSLGWTHLDAVRSSLIGAELRAFALADNKTSDLAGWDFEMVASILEGIQAEEASLLDATGFLLSDLIPITEEEHSVSGGRNGAGTEKEKESREESAAARNRDAADHPRTEYHTIAFAVDQWEVISQAIDKFRVQEGDDSIGGARVLELLCAEYLS
jgi:hypothetical protein